MITNKMAYQQGNHSHGQGREQGYPRRGRIAQGAHATADKVRRPVLVVGDRSTALALGTLLCRGTIPDHPPVEDVRFQAIGLHHRVAELRVVVEVEAVVLVALEGAGTGGEKEGE